MMRRVPILCHHHVLKTCGDAVDDWDHLFAVFDRQCASGQKTILHIDYDKGA